MPTTVCLCVKTFHYPEAGGVMWAYLNWALGLRALGCDVIWAEEWEPEDSPERVAELVANARRRLAPYGLADRLALLPWRAGVVWPPDIPGTLPYDATFAADLLLNFAYALPADVLRRFKRTALIDIDPGLLQYWVHMGTMTLSAHDLYFTIGETVGRPGSGIPDLGREWHYTPPCVALDWWPVARAPQGAPFTTVTHWGGEWAEDSGGVYDNSKRAGFAPYLDLPRRVREKLELVVFFAERESDEGADLCRRGWSFRNPTETTATAAAYRRYLQDARGEFSCAKPSCVRMQNAWVSDRTICFLAAGKPVVIEHTGPSRVLPDAKGMFRFRTIDEAARYLNGIGDRYEEHCRDARHLAETVFDAKTVVAAVLARALAS